MANATGKASRASPRRASLDVVRPSAERTRLNLVYRGTEMQALLEKLQRFGHHGTVTETVARALRIYEAILDEREAGNRIVVQTREGKSMVYVI